MSIHIFTAFTIMSYRNTTVKPTKTSQESSVSVAVLLGFVH